MWCFACVDKHISAYLSHPQSARFSPSHWSWVKNLGISSVAHKLVSALSYPILLVNTCVSTRCGSSRHSPGAWLVKPRVLWSLQSLEDSDSPFGFSQALFANHPVSLQIYSDLVRFSQSLGNSTWRFVFFLPDIDEHLGHFDWISPMCQVLFLGCPRKRIVPAVKKLLMHLPE